MIDPDRLIKLTQKLIQYNSENPPGNELALGRFIEKDMRSLGLAVKVHHFAKNRPNIIATLKGTAPRAKAAKDAVLITPHYDTVPIGKGWTFDPLGGTIHKGRIYGRGASDDKGNLACCMEVMRSLVEDGVRLKHDVIMAATADEETGSHYGIVPLLERKILTPGVGVIVDSFEFDTIVAQKGLIHCRVQIAGKKAHGAYNWLGVSAIELSAKIITRLKAMRLPYKTKHPLLALPTLNVGVISGGDKVNMVADHCEFALDIRFLPGTTADDILRQVKQVIRGVTAKFKIEIDDIQQPYEIDPHHPLVQTFLKTSRRLKARARLKGSEGATVISFFKKQRIPAFATGFGAYDTAHATDEYAEVKTLIQGACVLEQYLKDYDELIA